MRGAPKGTQTGTMADFFENFFLTNSLFATKRIKMYKYS